MRAGVGGSIGEATRCIGCKTTCNLTRLAMDAQAKLDDIAKQIQSGERSPTVTVRAFLSWFEAQRRGFAIVSRIRETLDQACLRTVPDFQSAYIDSEITFTRVEKYTEAERYLIQRIGSVGSNLRTSVYSPSSRTHRSRRPLPLCSSTIYHNSR